MHAEALVLPGRQSICVGQFLRLVGQLRRLIRAEAAGDARPAVGMPLRPQTGRAVGPRHAPVRLPDHRRDVAAAAAAARGVCRRRSVH